MIIHSYYFSFQKRFFDCAGAAFLLVGLSPLLLIIALSIALTSGFPVIFRQKRTGRGGQEFWFFKFRTMRNDAEKIKTRYQHLNEAPAPMFKIHNDPRFTAVGAVLSKSGLDELPQLWNILRGEMSFVGPRPLPIAEAQKLPQAWRAWREQVRPGVFSDWAFSPKRHESLTQWKKLEETTVQTGSLWYDLQTILATLKSLLP